MQTFLIYHKISNRKPSIEDAMDFTDEEVPKITVQKSMLSI